MGFRAAHILANDLRETAGKHTYVISSSGLPLAVGSGLTWVVGDEPGAITWAQHSREESFLWGLEPIDGPGLVWFAVLCVHRLSGT